MTHPHERALEAAARALDKYTLSKARNNTVARVAVIAYLDAMPPPVSPELIAGLNKLATYLTEQGEYEAVDLIDTVVARLTPELAALAGSGEK